MIENDTGVGRVVCIQCELYKLAGGEDWKIFPLLCCCYYVVAITWIVVITIASFSTLISSVVLPTTMKREELMWSNPR